MISRRFAPPNFVVDASEEDGKRRKWMTWASSEQAVVLRLEREEWTVHAVEPYDFDDWLRHSTVLLREIEDARREGRKPDFDGGHYGKLKHHLFELFEGKCAYCEGKAMHVASGDVEHFRPKRGVNGDPDHPGYYWLAYDVGNLLPACELCNRAGAKMNKFPVEPGTRAATPAAIAGERPLLLNPYFDARPLEHLKFLKSGKVVGRTEKGKHSIEVYRLNRRELKRRREERIAELEKDLKVDISRKDLEEAAGDAIEELKEGRREYSAALLSVLPDWIERRVAGLGRVREKLLSP